MRVTPQSLPIPQTQAPSAPSSSPCSENAERRASEAEAEWLRWPYPTTRKPWCKSNRVPLCLGYPVHRSLPPTRRSSSDENLVPGEAWDKPLNSCSMLEIQAVFLLLCLWSFQAVRSTSVDVVPLAVNAATTEPPSRRRSKTSAPYSRA